MKNNTFTSESVCAGHPDKICDQISDAILDEVLKQDKNGKVAVETLVTVDRVVIAGEINTTATINIEQIARREIKRLGYIDESFDFWYKSPIDVYVHLQSPEISIGVNEKEGAGDQGMMFGYSCTDTEMLMPLSIMLSHKLAEAIDNIRESKILPYLRPDGKTQVSIEYRHDKPYRVKNVVIGVPHDENTKLTDVTEDIYKKVIIPTLDTFGFKIGKKDLIVNGTGVWHKGGPASDTGLTGRKIIVDSYGGYARIGGGCFSGKDPTKVDRSGAYAARFIAKNIVAKGLAEKVEVRLAYVIGNPKPLMKEIETFGTQKVSGKVLNDFTERILDTSVRGIIEELDLLRPIYLPTAAYGHFGRDRFPWEKISD